MANLYTVQCRDRAVHCLGRYASEDVAAIQGAGTDTIESISVPRLARSRSKRHELEIGYTGFRFRLWAIRGQPREFLCIRDSINVRTSSHGSHAHVLAVDTDRRWYLRSEHTSGRMYRQHQSNRL